MNLKRALVYLLFLCPLAAFGAVPVTLAPVAQQQFFDANGNPLAFGCVFTYQSGTTTQLLTYTDYTGLIPNPDPVPLSASGSANIWLQSGQLYTIVVKSNGGTDCSLGTTMYTVDGVGGGNSQTTTVIPSSPTPSFPVIAQFQLFQITLTSNTVALPVTFVNVQAPALITFEIIENATGGWTWSWPTNTAGGAGIDTAANHTTTQSFIWDGTNISAVGTATYVSSGALAGQNFFDFGLTASLPVCTNAAFQLTSVCTGLIPNSALTNSSVTYNGQAVALGATGNVNVGAAAHSVALNQGNGSAITGLALTNDQAPVGRTGADPVATAIPNCTTRLTYDTSAHTFGCNAAPVILASVEFTSCALAANGGEWNCQGNIAWGLTLPNTSYKVMCSISNPPGGYAIPAGYDAHLFFGTKTTTQTGYTINDDHSGSLGATYTVDCIATQ